jgi:exopolysaccharide production protein ExoZ
LATAAAIAVGWLKPTFFYHMDASAENTLLSLAFIPHESQTGAAPVLWQGWTLEYEMFFYALCTLALLLLPGANRLKTLAALLVLLSAIGLMLAPSQPIARAYTSPLLLEFAAGLGLATAWRARLMPGAAVGVAALIAGLAIYAALQNGALPASGVRVIDWGVPAFLVVAGALCFEAGGRVAHSRFGLLLGDAS